MTEKREEGSPAHYGGATPEEVALAVLRYRPGKKKQASQNVEPSEERKQGAVRAPSAIRRRKERRWTSLTVS